MAILLQSAWTGCERVESLPASATIEPEERHAEAGGRDRNRHTQQQAEDAPQPAALAECETKSDDHDGQDAQRLGHRPGETGQHLIQWTLPRKWLATVGGRGASGVWNCDGYCCPDERRHQQRGSTQNSAFHRMTPFDLALPIRIE